MPTEPELSEEENKRVRDAVRELLEQHGSQAKLAPLLGVKQGSLSSLVRGKTGASYALAKKVARLKHISVSALLGHWDEVRTQSGLVTAPAYENLGDRFYGENRDEEDLLDTIGDYAKFLLMEAAAGRRPSSDWLDQFAHRVIDAFPLARLATLILEAPSEDEKSWMTKQYKAALDLAAACLAPRGQRLARAIDAQKIGETKGQEGSGESPPRLRPSPSVSVHTEHGGEQQPEKAKEEQ